MEIEAKFRIAASELATLAKLRRLGAYTLKPAPAPEQQENIYYDTPDARLTTARYGLRVRRVGSRALVTLKGPAEVGTDGIHRRSEFEFHGDQPDPTSWPPGVARDLALALTGGAALAPLAAVLTERYVLHAIFNGVEVAEICLDHGLLRGGDREQPFAEVEIELLSAGSANDLATLAAALGEHATLEPESQTKLQRALALRQLVHV
ncbi:MAG: CYTH domain-containing protein [Candidatus Viridilinea halotolerans]|uniref:CYTH domain-containing protein n=1 Tax=Candidatus Viridilinea halotolerans TaxID=2491704 RepID=A0A426TUK8_9CHLR|nr:MAG: CYTH domain-containing protein [Candidatus Viridilinea halotolerans]